MADSQIVIKGARQHNLKNIDITVPRDKFVVITGLSGSGKSSLAFDTITLKGSAAISNHFPLMPASFWGKWTSPMWII